MLLDGRTLPITALSVFSLSNIKAHYWIEFLNEEAQIETYW